MEKKYYIAYGSNLNVRHMQRRCLDASPIGTAVILDYQLLYKGSKTCAYLTIEPKKGGIVPIVVWEISYEDEKKIDVYEGWPTLYYKKMLHLPVKKNDGKIVELDAFVYIMHEENPIGIPTPFYTRICEEGYKHFGFDLKILEYALKISMSNM